MAKYRKLPVIIEAEQWFPGRHILGVKNIDGKDYGEIDTKEGTMAVTSGDWVITGVMGERYPCKPDIFEMTYELVE